VLDAATFARARRRVRRGLAVRVFAIAFFLVCAVVCLIRSHIAAAAILLAGAAFMFGSVMVWHFLLRRMKEAE
jgi:energy-coupling factor transporter transmembrane protein EcfT